MPASRSANAAIAASSSMSSASIDNALVASAASAADDPGRRSVAITRHPRFKYSRTKPRPRPREAPTISAIEGLLICLCWIKVMAGSLVDGNVIVAPTAKCSQCVDTMHPPRWVLEIPFSLPEHNPRVSLRGIELRLLHFRSPPPRLKCLAGLQRETAFAGTLRRARGQDRGRRRVWQGISTTGSGGPYRRDSS